MVDSFFFQDTLSYKQLKFNIMMIPSIYKFLKH